MMRYVERDAGGKIVGHFANENAKAKEMVADDHPDLVAYNLEREEKHRPRVRPLQARVAELEKAVENLKRQLGFKEEPNAEANR